MKEEEKNSFYSKELRLKYRIAPTTLSRRLNELNRYGYIKVVGGTRAKGYEYEVENVADASSLKSAIKTAFDEVLEKIKMKIGSPVAQG